MIFNSGVLTNCCAAFFPTVESLAIDGELFETELIHLVLPAFVFSHFLTFWRLCMEQLWGRGTWSRDGHQQLWPRILYIWYLCTDFLSYPLECPPPVLHSCRFWFLAVHIITSFPFIPACEEKFIPFWFDVKVVGGVDIGSPGAASSPWSLDELDEMLAPWVAEMVIELIWLTFCLIL